MFIKKQISDKNIILTNFKIFGGFLQLFSVNIRGAKNSNVKNNYIENTHIKAIYIRIAYSKGIYAKSIYTRSNYIINI